ncbi:MAG TPA: Eco57I restriction-modification methylase domain-containing protein [Kofleriaceae bacterium]|nr:Eco57I restriction-modification methylase domain-containing protein [Kofleriaceae bacterium]
MYRDTRPLGVVYTPPEVAGPMVERALAPLLEGCRDADELLALRICDFAVGEGAFLVEVVRVLADRLRALRGDPEAAARRAVMRCLAGIEIDPRAAAAAKQRLGLDDRQLRVGDALTLDWPAGFPRVFARGGFDAVVGNPPYIRQERLRDAKAALQQYASYDGVADLYVYFVELAHRIVRPGGRYCLITPNKWLSAAYGRPLRSYLAAQASIDGIADVSRTRAFVDADAFPCIVWGTRRSDGAAATTPITTTRSTTTVADALADGGIAHPRARWQAEPWHLDRDDERALLDRLDARWPRLADLVGRPSRGVVTGCNRAFVIDRATRDRLLDADPFAAPLIRPFVKGRDVARWQVRDGERWILLVDRDTVLDEHPALVAHLAQFRAALEPRPARHRGTWAGRKPGSYRWYELQDPVGELAKSRAPRLFYQDIQTSPACSLDASGELVPDTTVWILPTADRYLLALLNSRLYGWYAQRRFPPALNGAVRPKLAYMRALPVATPARDARAAIVALVEARLAGEPVDAALDVRIEEVYELSAAERALLS